MEISLDLYLAGLNFFSDPMMYVYSIFGTLVGIIFGALPGLTATMTIAVFIPFTFGVPAVQSFAFLLGLYSGAVYGGSISAILINIPGTPSAIATGFDGYPMCQQGRAGEAIGVSTIASGSAVFSAYWLAFAAPLVAGIALKFGAEEYVGLTLIGLSIVAIISPGSTIKALIAGILVSSSALSGSIPWGISPGSFSTNPIWSPINEIPVMIGIYGLSEMLLQISDQEHTKIITQKLKNVLPSIRSVIRLLPTIIRSSIIGVIIGAIPATGGSIAALVAYGQEKRFSRNADKLGTGIPEGVAAPEASNNASTGGALIPMMTLGIPGDPMTAVLMGGLIIQGTAARAALLRAEHALCILHFYQPAVISNFHDRPWTCWCPLLCTDDFHTEEVSHSGDTAVVPDRFILNQ